MIHHTKTGKLIILNISSTCSISLSAFLNYYCLAQVLVHVSTAYANCDRDAIEERIYPPSVDPDRLANSIGYSYIVE